MRISGVGLVPATYDPETKLVSYRVTQKLYAGQVTVIVSATVNGRKTEARWSFNVGSKDWFQRGWSQRGFLGGLIRPAAAAPASGGVNIVEIGRFENRSISRHDACLGSLRLGKSKKPRDATPLSISGISKRPEDEATTDFESMKKITPNLSFEKRPGTRRSSIAPFSPVPRSRITALHDTPSGTVDVVSFELSGQPFMAIARDRCSNSTNRSRSWFPATPRRNRLLLGAAHRGVPEAQQCAGSRRYSASRGSLFPASWMT